MQGCSETSSKAKSQGFISLMCAATVVIFKLMTPRTIPTLCIQLIFGLILVSSIGWASAARAATLRVVRVDSFNGSNRPPTIWINDGVAIDLTSNQRAEFQIPQGPNLIKVALRVPADQSQFMQWRELQLTVEANEVITIEVSWVANLFVGSHSLRVSSRSIAQNVAIVSSAIPLEQKVSENLTPQYPAKKQEIAANSNGPVRIKSSYSWPNGDRYEGDFVDGQRTGTGTLTWTDGRRYTGDFVNGAFTGQGKYVGSDGTIYDGTFVQGHRTGRGHLVWPNGHQYVGNFNDGTRTGYGVYSWPNGDRYEGEFANNQRHGQGVNIHSNGQRTAGIFQNGNLLSAPTQPSSTNFASPLPSSSGESSAGIELMLNLLNTVVESKNSARSEALREPLRNFPPTISCESRDTRMGQGMGGTVYTTCR